MRALPLFSALVVLVVIIGLVAFGLYFGANHQNTSTTSSFRPVILYVNQGNGIVDRSNYNEMQSFAIAEGFNTIFFQVYRGSLIFSTSDLSYFVTSAHSQGLEIFFALYFTNDTQTIPSSIYSIGEDGISLDMSTLSESTQGNLLATLQANFHGINAVTTFDFGTSLKPQWLIFETYGPSDNQYIHKGIIASVGVFTMSSKSEYIQSFNYALANSDGVMVFDYATLKSSGY